MLKLLACLAVAATISTGTMEDQKLPQVSTQEAFNKNDGKQIVLTGTYAPLMLPQSKRPGSTMVASGRMSIQLDKFNIALERGNQGFRDSTEVKKFKGKKVKVTGTANKYTTLWGDGKEQSIVMPAIVEIKKIELAK